MRYSVYPAGINHLFVDMMYLFAAVVPMTLLLLLFGIVNLPLMKQRSRYLLTALALVMVCAAWAWCFTNGSSTDVGPSLNAWKLADPVFGPIVMITTLISFTIPFMALGAFVQIYATNPEKQDPKRNQKYSLAA